VRFLNPAWIGSKYSIVKCRCKSWRGWAKRSKPLPHSSVKRECGWRSIDPFYPELPGARLCCSPSFQTRGSRSSRSNCISKPFPTEFCSFDTHRSNQTTQPARQASGSELTAGRLGTDSVGIGRAIKLEGSYSSRTRSRPVNCPRTTEVRSCSGALRPDSRYV